jgi:predicted hydrocarbon binding protein
MSTANYTRADLLRYTATMNHLRTGIYHLVRRMKVKNISNIEERLQAMGRRIGVDFARTWAPETKTFDKFIKEAYFGVLRSKVKLDVDLPAKTVKVTDDKCPHCKYQFEDISFAGCNVVVGFMEAYTHELKQAGKINFELKSLSVTESKTRGNENCVHMYRVEGTL